MSILSNVFWGKTNWKAIIFLIILAFLVGGGALWYTRRLEQPYQPLKIKKVDETADWKTYSNKEYGFEVKYPNDWLVEPEDFSSPETKLVMVFGNYSIEEGDYEENYQSVIIEVDEVSMDEFLTNAKDIGAKIEEITIGSKKGYRFTTTGEEEDPLGIGFLPGIIAAAQNNNYIYIIGVVSPNNISEKVLNQMVSTFQFTEMKAGTTKEQSCINYGGTVTTSLCCKSSSDFPNSCLIGACGCSPTDSHEIKTCDCGEGKCFDGEKCVGNSQQEGYNITKDTATGWNIYTDTNYGFEFKYPDNFFWWEPKVVSIDCEYANFSENCPYINFEGKKVEKQQALNKGWFEIEKLTINQTPYCFWSWDEGAAGSTFITSYYSTIKDDECFAVTFTLRNTNCGTVFMPTEENYKNCQQENTVTKPALLQQIISTFRFLK